MQANVPETHGLVVGELPSPVGRFAYPKFIESERAEQVHPRKMLEWTDQPTLLID